MTTDGLGMVKVVAEEASERFGGELSGFSVQQTNRPTVAEQQRALPPGRLPLHRHGPRGRASPTLWNHSSLSMTSLKRLVTWCAWTAMSSAIDLPILVWQSVVK
jgi:hypothetical protein